MGCILKGGGGLYSRVMVGAVLLAAGSASRMGHRPKSLLELGGVSLIRRQLIALSGAGVDEVVVVLGHYADRIEEAVKEFPVTLVRNLDPDAGQVSSLRLGLQSLSVKLDAVLVALADQPLQEASRGYSSGSTYGQWFAREPCHVQRRSARADFGGRSQHRLPPMAVDPS
jgi:molybdenum cofactor cytidylyltransferase